MTQKRIFEDEIVKEIIESYKNKVSVKEICKKNNCCRGVIYKILKVNKIECYPNGTFLKGKKPWNTGLTIEDERVKKCSKNQRKTILKRYADGEIVPWNKGLTKETSERVKNYSKKLEGKHQSKESIEKMRNSLIEYNKTHKNPMFGKHPSEETKRKMREARLGIPLSEEVKQRRKNNPNAGMKGKHQSKETIEKRASKLRGKPLSEEHRKRLRKPKTRTEKLKNRFKLMKGRIPWNKGKKDYLSEETKRKMSVGSIGRIPTEESRKKMREHRSKQIFPKEDTSIERKIQDLLKKLGIEFIAHFYIAEIEHRYRCDIFIPTMKLVIECDGNWWHGNPEMYSEEELTKKQREQKERDELRTKELKEKGYGVIRLWEKEIHIMDVNKLKDILISKG